MVVRSRAFLSRSYVGTKRTLLRIINVSGNMRLVDGLEGQPGRWPEPANDLTFLMLIVRRVSVSLFITWICAGRVSLQRARWLLGDVLPNRVSHLSAFSPNRGWCRAYSVRVVTNVKEKQVRVLVDRVETNAKVS